MNLPKLILMTLMIAVPATLRLVDIGWNAIPIGAVALFAGATFRHRGLALAVPVCAMLISDLALGFVRHDFAFYTFHPLLPVVYGCYLASVCLGFGIRAHWNRLDTASEDLGAIAERAHAARGDWTMLSRRAVPVAFGTLAGAFFFFFATNFGDWLVYYEHSWNGFVTCFAKAIPFFRNTLAADTFGAIVLFSGYEILCRRAAISDPTGLLHAR